jgi:tellurite resistance protein|tara:strand:+ start:5016 stop:6278 length:1263 start_codon:yes stop_codon:yes gene_type:complete
MELICYKDFQYSREKIFFKRIEPRFNEILKEHPELKKEFFMRESQFYHLISNAVQVDEHYVVRNITRQINRYLKTDFNIKIYVFQAEKFQAHCTPRINYSKGKSKKEELIILVSQHFFNSLGEYERVSVIAHELAHMVFGHVHIPVDILLKKNFDLEYIEDFKADLLKWALCREITSDIFSLIAGDFNHAIASRALIKFTTGLNDVFGDDMISMTLNQYEMIADAAYQEKVSTHPLMPLRIKLINSVIDTGLVKNFGKEVGIRKKQLLVKEYNSIIDEIVYKVYPEVIKDNFFLNKEIMFNMSVAVALSDGEISSEELKAIRKSSKSKFNYRGMLMDIEKQVTLNGSKKMVSELIRKSVKATKQENLTKNDLIPLIRQLIIVAASDGKVDIDELNTIMKYGKEFKFNRQDVIVTLSSLGF